MNRILLIFVGFLLTTTLVAQNDLKETLNRSQQSSYITFEKFNKNIDDNLVFEFGLQHNFYFHYEKFLPKFWLAFRPEINFRMRDSFVILNPAYRFDVSFYYDWSKKEKHRLFILGYDHHSNGKQGSFLNQQTGEINIDDGDFATDFFKIGYLQNQQFAQKEDWYILQQYQLRYDPGIIRASLRTDLYEHYNQLRINGFWQLLGKIRQSKTRFSIDFRLEVLLEDLNQGSFKDRLIADFRLNVQPAIMRPPDMWLFAQAYAGEDYYQIYFFRRIEFIRLGLTMRIW